MLRIRAAANTHAAASSRCYRWPSNTLRKRCVHSNDLTGTSTIRSKNVVLALLGLGTISAAGYFLFPASYTVHADADLSLSGKRRELSDSFSLKHSTQHPAGIPFLVPGTQRVDGFSIESNNPNEDGAVVLFHPFSNTLGYLYIGIFDGHNGPYTAGHLSNGLGSAIFGSIADVYSMHAEKNRTVDVSSGLILIVEPGAAPDPVPSDDEINEAIRKTFVAYDDVYVHEAAQRVLGLDNAAYAALQANNAPDPTQPAGARNMQHETPLEDAVRKLAYAHSGSCALVGLFNTADRSLRVALTGDSRAVLGRRVPASPAPDGSPRYTYEVHHLTADQNAKNEAEAARLTALHPDEPDLLKDKRVVGWGPARAFGDGSMKWSRAVQARLHAEALGDRPRAVCKTPPYFTAEPVITTTPNVRRGDFAVFASDGLWDCLTSEEVVGLVGAWLEVRGTTDWEHAEDGTVYEVRVPNAPTVSQPSQVPDSSTPTAEPLILPEKTYAPKDLPVMYPDAYQDLTPMYKYWRKEKNYVVSDDNVAVHITRNALGGADRDLREALLAMQNPRARRFRDDISVVVVFFD